MRRKHLRKVSVFAIAVLILIAAIAFSDYVSNMWPSLQPGDKGTWMGAIGTVATLAGTIWLATSERRRRAREERALAELTCVEIIYRHDHVSADVGAVIDILEGDVMLLSSSDCERCADRLSMVQTWNIKELLPIISLANDPASKLIVASQNIARVEMQLRRIDHLNAEQFLVARSSMIAALKHSSGGIDQAMGECVRFLNR